MRKESRKIQIRNRRELDQGIFMTKHIQYLKTQDDLVTTILLNHIDHHDRPVVSMNNLFVDKHVAASYTKHCTEGREEKKNT